MMDVMLPIYDIDEEIVEALALGNRLVLSAPTGSGKSTQVPQILLDSGLLGGGRCIVMQPRRIAARMLARRVAEERGSALGGEVGYQIRLDNVSSEVTRILYATEGILLRRLLGDPHLEGISAIIFDEFHERHLYGDITLARAIELQESSRPDLRIVVMSATLEGSRIKAYLGGCPELTAEGRTYPVEIEYLKYEPHDDSPWELAAESVAEEFDRTEGDILVFMPGAYEIGRTIRELENRIGRLATILPLHGELQASDQDRAVAKSANRKIIVSTNVAETSLTIDGVRTVIDAGLARVQRHDPNRGINTLLIDKISKASADQRAGRAGRTSAGRCLRLWTERDHSRRAEREAPEVLRLDLAEVCLTLKASGVSDLQGFRWIDAPDPRAVQRAEELLHDLGALDASGGVTSTGREMLKYPVHPRYARMFVAARQLGCLRAAALIAALTQSRRILVRTDRKTEDERREIFGMGRSDFFLHMRAFAWAERKGFSTRTCRELGIHAEASRQVHRLFRQFLEIAEADEESPATDDAIAKCILAGFADQVARRRTGGTLQCDVVHGRTAHLARDSVAQGSHLVVASEINEIEGRDGEVKTLLSMVTELEEPWLEELFPEDFSQSEEFVFDAVQKRVVVRKHRHFRDLVLEYRERDAAPSPAAAACLAEAVRDSPLDGWNDEARQFVARTAFLAEACPDLGIKAIGDDAMALALLELCEGATRYREVKDKPLLPILKNLFTPMQVRDIESHAPSRIRLPAGRHAPVRYEAGQPPTLSATIQDLYGLSETPRIAMGYVPLRIQILGPHRRPVQTTSDMKSFWTTGYPGLRPELQRRYPKHEWR